MERKDHYLTTDPHGLVVRPGPGNLIIGAITITPTGRVIIPEGMDLDDAARQFWAAVERIGLRLVAER